MYKNVQVNHYNSATGTTTSPTSTPFASSFSHETNQPATSFSVPIATSVASSLSIPIVRPSPFSNSTIGTSLERDGGISLPVSYNISNENTPLAQSSKMKSDVDQLDDLVKDLLTEVNRPIGPANTNRPSTSTITTTSNTNTNNNNNNNKYSTSSYSYHRQSNNENNEQINTKLPSSIRASSYAQASALNNHKRNDSDANTVSGLIDGSSISVNGTQREEQRVKSTREERIRIKRGGASSTDIPITTSSSTTTTTTTTKQPIQTSSSRDQLSIDEQLIDSLLESVQNTLRKRTQQQRSHQTNWTTDVPVQHQQIGPNRRTYSSSAAFTDSIHRVSRICLRADSTYSSSLFFVSSSCFD
jgi:hypothetical protein